MGLVPPISILFLPPVRAYIQIVFVILKIDINHARQLMDERTWVPPNLFSLALPMPYLPPTFSSRSTIDVCSLKSKRGNCRRGIIINSFGKLEESDLCWLRIYFCPKMFCIEINVYSMIN